MAKKISEFRGETDRQRVIRWLKADLDYYKTNLGEETEFGTIVTDNLIKAVENRLDELKNKENTNTKILTKLI